MAGAPGSLKALPALVIALLIAVVLAISQRTVGPSRAELSQALTRAGKDRIASSDVRSLRCAEAATGGYACRWQQREEDAWIERSGRALVDGRGWRIEGANSDRRQ